MPLKNINKIFIFLICLSVFLVLTIAGQIADEYVLLEFNYSNGSISLISKSLEQGNYPAANLDKNYQFNILSGDKNILYSTGFSPELLYSDGGQDELEGGLLTLNQAVFYVSVPNFEESRKVEIIKEGKLVFEEEIYDVGATSCRIK